MDLLTLASGVTPPIPASLGLPIVALAVVVGFREARTMYNDHKAANAPPPDGIESHYRTTERIARKLSDDPPRENTEAITKLTVLATQNEAAMKRHTEIAEKSLIVLGDIRKAIVNGNRPHQPGGGV